jgi:hypothetical protein
LACAGIPEERERYKEREKKTSYFTTQRRITGVFHHLFSSLNGKEKEVKKGDSVRNRRVKVKKER